MRAETPELAEMLEVYQLQAKDILAAAFLPVNSVPALDTLSPELRLLINLELKQKEQDKAIEAVNQAVFPEIAENALTVVTDADGIQHLIDKDGVDVGTVDE